MLILFWSVTSSLAVCGDGNNEERVLEKMRKMKWRARIHRSASKSKDPQRDAANKIFCEGSKKDRSMMYDTYYMMYGWMVVPCVVC